MGDHPEKEKSYKKLQDEFSYKNSDKFILKESQNLLVSVAQYFSGSLDMLILILKEHSKF